MRPATEAPRAYGRPQQGVKERLEAPEDPTNSARRPPKGVEA